jgi:hypothetical protein
MSNRNRKKSGKRSTPKQRAAGRANLIAFRGQNGRPALSHGIHAALSGSPLPPGAEDIAERVDGIIVDMETDLGGRDELTAAKKSILASQRLCLTVIFLAERYLRAEGLLDRRGRPHPILSTCTSFANCLRHNALALGLERRPKKAGPASLVEYLSSKQESATVPEASS